MKLSSLSIHYTCCVYVQFANCVDRHVYYLRHSGNMHFSTCSSSSVHSPSSTGDLSIRCRVLSPFPHVTLQSLQSDHGVSMQGIVSVQQETLISTYIHWQYDGIVYGSINAWDVRIQYMWFWTCCYSRHSGIIHFSTSSTSAPQMEPSAGGIFTMRSLLFMPRPQVALQASHSPHSVTRQLLEANTKKGSWGWPTALFTLDL